MASAPPTSPSTRRGGTHTAARITIAARSGENEAAYNLSGGSLQTAVVNSGTFNYTGGAFTGSFTNNSGGVLTLGGGQQRVLEGPVVNGGELRVAAGTAGTVTGGVAGTGPGASAARVVRVEPGSSLETPFVRQQALHAGDTVRVRAASAGGLTSRLQTLDIGGSPGGWTGRVDLADTALVDTPFCLPSFTARRSSR